MKNTLSILPAAEHRKKIDYILLGALIGSIFFFLFSLALFRVVTLTYIHICVLVGLNLYVRKMWTACGTKKFYHYVFVLLTIIGGIGYVIYKYEALILLSVLGCTGFIIVRLLPSLSRESKKIVYSEQEHDQNN
ncbi:hypothetical protein [Bacillus sp. Marseille-P3661]|uniref:hypothetical protein n=1 Tax=Bacillus sp. Marseille-P3661 TaxID=1936234 RepID=UPI000C861E76|nr:hypothetical protein [Bacillus sp. Marseille-P3661]